MKQGCKKFNIRAAVIQMLGIMAGVDPIIYIKSQVTNTVWKMLEEIHMGNVFTDAFNAKQEMMGKGPTRVKNDTISPGIITELHPTFIQIEDNKAKLKQALGALPAPDNNITKDWLETYCPNYEGTKTQVPEFKVLMSAVKWGEGDNWIKITVLKI
eukprot:7869058-Ditylum_brightwellii.AAC.1